MKRIALITMILLGLLMPAPMPAFSAAGEKDALIALYNSTNGASWYNKWDTAATNHCTWHGVTCDGSGKVTVLNLNNNNLSGPIPPELGSLSNLQGLYLNNNLLSGPIPPQLGSLANLVGLYLDNNPGLVCWETQAALFWAKGLSPNYSGPTVTCDYIALVALFDSTNGAGWTDKTNWTMNESYCTWYGVTCVNGNVRILNLANNNLNGLIPPQLGNLANLVSLFLDENKLSGPIPAALANLFNLYLLSLGNNPALECWETQAALTWAQGLSA